MNEELLTACQIDHPLPLTEEQLEEMRTAIRERLEKTNKGGTTNSIANCQLILRHDPIFKGKIRRNELTGCTDIVGGMPWQREGTLLSDKDIPHILLYLEQHYGITSEKKILHALEVIANENHFHPIRDYLNSLTWDGVPRVREALHHFLGADISDFNEQCLRVFMLGAVNRVFHPGCKFELMLVLVGGQGAGKTTFVRFLAVKEDWFTDDIRKLDDENIYRRIMSHWIVEMSEMVATANAKSIEEIKSFLSRSKDTYKVPYDRFPADRPRQCVFAGTTNRMDFLPMDRTGNRRFLPVQVHPERADIHILSDEAASRAYFDQLWAEIMVQYRSSDFSTHLSREMEQQLVQEQALFQQEDILAGQIIGFMEDYSGDRLCSKQIYREALEHPYDEPKAWETREICEIVNLAIAGGELPGWRAFTSPRRFPKYGTQRGWERIPKNVNNAGASGVNKHVNQPEKIEQMGFTLLENDEDCPFSPSC